MSCIKRSTAQTSCSISIEEFIAWFALTIKIVSRKEAVEKRVNILLVRQVTYKSLIIQRDSKRWTQFRKSIFQN